MTFNIQSILSSPQKHQFRGVGVHQGNCEFVVGYNTLHFKMLELPLIHKIFWSNEE
jgi:hypothetical protein